MVSGGTVSRSILGSKVRVSSGATVEDSILFDDVHIEQGAQVRNCIIDKGVRVPKNETVGITPTIDADRFTISENGVVVIPLGYHFTPSEILPLIQDQTEFFTTVSAGQVVASTHFPNRRANLGQDSITDTMSISVVDCLEMIEIKKQQAEFVAITSEIGNRGIQSFIKGSAVCEVRQWIEQRLLSQHVTCPLASQS